MDDSMRVLHPTTQKTPKRRRNRSTKACQPCRERKVRCNLELPCSTCKKRDHVHLCRYGSKSGSTDPSSTNSKSTAKQSQDAYSQFIVYVPGISSATPSPSLRQQDEDEDTENSFDSSVADVSTLPEDLVSIFDSVAENVTESCDTDKLTNETLFVGRNSSVAFLRSLASVYNVELVPDHISIESAFALNNRTVLHPFGSLWTTVDVKITDVLQALPNAETCMKYYRSYQHTVKPFYPFLLDPDGFELRLCDFLQVVGDLGIDATSEELFKDTSFQDAAWYGLLFAVLASGCQFSDIDPKDRILRSRVFTVCAFECLRLANLYVQPCVDVIQCMLLLEFSIANDSNPGVALGLLGLTAQQAQALGLHLKRKVHATDSSPREEVHPLWRAVMFLDSVLSCAYDRRPVSFLPVGYTIINNPTTTTFADIMWAIHALNIEWQKASSDDPHAVRKIGTITPYLNTLDCIENAAKHSVLAFQSSDSIRGRQEELVYTVYVSCFKYRLAKSACLSKCPSESHRTQFFECMKFGLRGVLRAFLALKQLTPIAAISWDILHRSITSSVLLAALAEVHQTTEDRELLEKYFHSLSDFAMNEEQDHEAALMISTPYCHGLDTLRFLMDKQTLHS